MGQGLFIKVVRVGGGVEVYINGVVRRCVVGQGLCSLPLLAHTFLHAFSKNSVIRMRVYKHLKGLTTPAPPPAPQVAAHTLGQLLPPILFAMM